MTMIRGTDPTAERPEITESAEFKAFILAIGGLGFWTDERSELLIRLIEAAKTAGREQAEADRDPVVGEGQAMRELRERGYRRINDPRRNADGT